MSKPKIEKTQQKAAAATVEKEESEEEGENSKDEAKPPTETPSSQGSSPSVTLSSLHQCPSLPTAPATPTTTSSPLISVAGATPETTASSLPTTSPPFLPPPPPLTIISAENNEETPSNSKPILPFSKADENKKEEGSNDQMSSLKLFKNTPGKPKESIFETKHSNLYALDKDYLSKLIETKQKYERLLKSHMKCVPEDELKEREKKIKNREREKECKRRGGESYEQKKKRLKEWRRAHRHEIERIDEIRGRCWIDSMEDSDRYGPKDPMKYTLKRAKKMKEMNEKCIKQCEKAIAKEKDAAKITIFIKGEEVRPNQYAEVQGQKWVALCPIWGMIGPFEERTRFSIVNFTDRHMEIKLRITGSENFKLTPMIQFLNPHSCQHVELIFLKKRRMRRPDERLTIYFNDLEDLHKMRKEFGKDKIDITRHYAGRITVPVFIHNWEFRYSAKPNNKLSDEVKEAGKRAKIYANDSKLEANYNYKESPTPSEEVSEDKVSKISKVSKKALLDDDLLSSSNSSKKRRLKEREEKERRQKKKKEKEEKEKKRNKKDGRIKADKNTTLESKEQISNASVSRDMAKEWAKTKK